MTDGSMTFGLYTPDKKKTKKTASQPKRYMDAPSRNEPHVIVVDFFGGGGTMLLPRHDYQSAKEDVHFINLIGYLNDRRVQNVYVIPVSKIQDVYPELTPKKVLAKGFVTEAERKKLRMYV